jgi:predicted ATPase
MSFELRPYLRGIELLRDQVDSFSVYPFSLPAVRHMTELEFHPKVTYIVGENGTGKSTILEALAVAWGFNPEGGSRNFNFSTRSSHSGLHECLRLIRGAGKPRDGFFFRAESFYNLATNLDQLGGTLINSYGGRSLHDQSHGEAFFATFLNRFTGQGLYILDEPESALSPLRQMSLLAIMHELVLKDSQFIIATHSPIVMAYPDAAIYQLTETGFAELPYEETEHYRVMKDFIDNRKRMLDILMQPE